MKREFLLLLLLSLLTLSLSNELSPPLVNLDTTLGASIHASSVCGDPPSQYVPPGSSLPTLLPCNASQSYPAANLLDSNTSTRWQSENTESPVHITLSLPSNQTFEVYLLFIYFYSQLPSSLLIEVSRDGALTYEPWQYYVTPATDGSDACQTAFGIATRSIPYDDDITNPRAFCTQYPQLSREADLSQLVWGPLFARSTISRARLDFIRVSHIRFVLSGFSSELSAPEERYYSLSEVEVFGRCTCYGHASSCDITATPYQCACEHNTTGNKCETCLPLYNQQPWMSSLSAAASFCESCNCMQHASSCEYSQLAEGQSIDTAGKFSGGGVCLNCQDNTMGYNCQQCRNITYRDPSLPVTDSGSCKPCNCHLPGTDNEADCVRSEQVATSPALPGDCFCLSGVGGAKCTQCLPHYYNTSASWDRLDCTECGCSIVGTVSGTVCDDVTGQCVCKENVGGSACDQCLDGFHTLSPQGCVSCSCDVGGSLSNVCNKSTGYCPCKPAIESQQCSEVATGFYLPSAHAVHAQAEYGTDANSQQLPLAASHTEFPGFLGQGYIVAGIGSAQTFLIRISVPTATTYRLVIRYVSDSTGFISFRFESLHSDSPAVQGVFSLSSLSSATYTQAQVMGSHVPLEISVTDPGEYLLNATRSERVLVDLITLVPTLYYQPVSILGDSAQNFTDNCDVTSNSLASDLCREPAFSISASLVAGATSCQCNSSWSISNFCQTQGGQCSCDPGVTGRQCDRCVFGLYSNGEEGCALCNCPNGDICDVVTGQCPCSTGVTGRQCDKCDVTFYRNITGTGSLACTPCECSSPGSLLDACDELSGACDCREGVAGRTCDQCRAYYWGLDASGCEACGCDMAGSEGFQCNLTSGQCSCKMHTGGIACSECAPGSFLLSSSTPTGCTQCYCFGLSMDCSPMLGTYLDVSLPLASDSWEAVSLTGSGEVNSESANVTGDVQMVSVSVLNSTVPLFLSFPLSELEMSLLLSYGGSITLSLSVSATHTSPSLLLYHSPQRLASLQLPAIQANTLTHYSSLLLEFLWRDVSGSAISRGEFIDLLVSSPRLLISIGESSTALLTEASIQRASLLSDTDSALPVERCQCPVQYSGHSCQRCASGYSRESDGTCGACQCNGHSAECDPETGTCIDCQDNTEGDSCQICLDTYFGDATLGSDQDCQSCPCSMYTATNQSCSPDALGDPVCSCKQGHIGRLCDRCDGFNNYHGDPVAFPNTSCSQCTCSGNIDFSVPNSCNTTTGQCTICINNSTGPDCQLCLSEFFGNASTQSCKPCQCDPTGSTTPSCNTTSGQCSCRPNVSIRQCDACDSDFYNFNSMGCDPCLCDNTGSSNSQCDVMTGQCPCRSGVGGQQCQSCFLGYFNFSDTGCSACSCGLGASNTSCDQTFGSCYCQPGVGGYKCDQCVPFYEDLMSSGCSKCDACTEQLGALAMSIESIDLLQVSDKLSTLHTLSSLGEGSLSSLRTSYRAVSVSVGEYRDDLVLYDSRIREINAGALNSSAEAISLTQTQIAESIETQGPATGGEFARIRDLALEVEMVLGLLENIQLTVLSLVPQLETQVDTAMLALASASQLLSDAQYNYSSNLSQAMDIFSYSDAAYNRSVRTARQLSSQESQLMLLYGVANSLNSSLQFIQYSLDRLKQRNTYNSELISSIRNSLLRASTSVNSFYDILNSNINPQIQEIQLLIQASIDASIAANEYYIIAARTLNGSPIAGHAYNIETADALISERITELRISQNDLNALLLRVETHQQELVANTTLIETYYNATHPVALEALAAITDYREVTRLIAEACVLANASLYAATAAVQESVSLVELGVLEQVALELRIARNLLNISIGLEAEALKFTSVELLALQGSINQTRNISDNVDLALSSARANLNSILSRAPFFFSQVNAILVRLPALSSCSDTSSSTAIELLPELRKRVAEIVRRIFNCSSAIREYDAQGAFAISLVNFTASALVERVQAISDSVRISDYNTAALQTLSVTVGNIESIRDRAFAAIATLKVALSLRANSSLTYPSLAANVPLHYTQVSIYFMPTATTGVLFYIQTGSGNFVSLHLEDGVLAFSIDLGLGPANVSIDGISLYQWYQVLATRDNQQLTMSLSSQQIDNIKTRRVDGSIDSSLSLLFPPGSTIYLGHRPQQGDGSNVPNFEGCVEDVIFNHMPMPLFKPLERSEELISCGFRPVARSYDLATWFYGGGYLVLELSDLLNPLNSSLVISFKTLRDGILLYSANTEDRTSLTLSINQGRVMLEIGDGEISGSVYSNQLVTDNSYHRVSLYRDGLLVSLQVDRLPASQLQLTRDNFSVDATLSVGAGADSAVAQSFSGVVTELYVNGVLADLRQATNVSRAIPFSPTYVTPGSFHIGSGYAQFPLPQSTISLLSIGFSFRTTSLTGLLLLLFADDSGSSPIHLSLEHGSLTLSYLYLGGLIPRQGVITLGGDLNEGEFHSVRIDFLSDRVSLFVDQLSASSSPFDCFDESSNCDIRVKTPLYMGGVPDSARLSLAVVTSYKGCIRDLQVNDVMYNYTQADILSGVSLYGCEPSLEAPMQSSTVAPTATSISVSPTTTLIPSSSLFHSISSIPTRSLILTSPILPTSTLEVSVSSTLSSILVSSSVPATTSREVPTSSPIFISPSLSMPPSAPLLTSSLAMPESTSLPFSSRFSQSISIPISSSSIVVPLSSSSVPISVSSSYVVIPVSSPSVPFPVSSPSVPFPVSSPSVAIPVSSPSVVIPVSSPSIVIPVSSPSVPFPVSSPSVVVPVSSPSIVIPVSSPSVPFPVSSPSVVLPVSSPSIVIPVSSPSIVIPVSSPSIVVPVSSPSIVIPVSSPSVPFPVSSPSVVLPVSSPSIVIPVSSPSIVIPVSSPSIVIPVSSPSVVIPVSSPSIVIPVSSPSIVIPVSSPSVVIPVSSSSIPTVSIASSQPFTRIVSSSVGIPESSSLPILSRISPFVGISESSSTGASAPLTSFRTIPTSSIAPSLASPTSSSLPPTIVTLPYSSPAVSSSPTRPFLSTSQPISISTPIPTSSSVVTPPTTTTPTPAPPVNACQTYPPHSPQEPFSAGYRFDGYNNSYVLLDIDPTELATDTVFRIELSSIAYNGIIFFVNGLNNYDFIELKFLEGRLQFSFSLGSNPTRVTTSHRYDDGSRYRIEATRLGPIGLLSVLAVTGNNRYVPREYVRTPIHDRAFTLFDLSNNFYFGGRPNQQMSADMCVTSLVINNLERLLSSGAHYRVNRCYSKISRGATFSGYGSYLQLFASYQVDRVFSAQFDFRTFNGTGVLFYIANSEVGDHLTVELRDGSIVYSVDNGELGNANMIAYTPDSPYYLCNGLWHSLSLSKQYNNITITVDGLRLERSIEDALTSVDTNNYPLFLGGIRPGVTPLSHVTKVPFAGCIRELFLNDEFIPLNSPGADSYRVEVAGCIL